MSAAGQLSSFTCKMGKTYQILVQGIEGQLMTVDVANTQEGFDNTSVLEFKKKLVKRMPGNIGNDHECHL